MLTHEEIIKRKEKRKEEIIKEMESQGLKIGIVVIKRAHDRSCNCDDCLTTPEPFCPFPEEHKGFVDCLLEAVK